MPPDERGSRGLKGAVAVAQEHTQVSPAEVGVDLVGHGEVEVAVTVELPDEDAAGSIPAGVEVRRCPEGAVAVAQQHGQARDKKVGHGKVGPAVAVDVP